MLMMHDENDTAHGVAQSYIVLVSSQVLGRTATVCRWSPWLHRLHDWILVNDSLSKTQVHIVRQNADSAEARHSQTYQSPRKSTILLNWYVSRADAVRYLATSGSRRHSADRSRSGVNVPGVDGRMCLHIAAMTNNIPLVTFLVDNDADKEATMTCQVGV